MQVGGHVCWRYEAVDPYLGGGVTPAVAVELRAMLSARLARVTAEAGSGRKPLLRAVQHLVRSFDVSALLEGKPTAALQLFLATEDGVYEHAAVITGTNDTVCIEWDIETWMIAFSARWSGDPAAWPAL